MSDCFIFQEVRSQMYIFGACQGSEKRSPAVWPSLLPHRSDDVPRHEAVILWRGKSTFVNVSRRGVFSQSEAPLWLLWYLIMVWIDEWTNGQMCWEACREHVLNCEWSLWRVPVVEEDLCQCGSPWEGDDGLTRSMLYEESRHQLCSTQGSEVKGQQRQRVCRGPWCYTKHCSLHREDKEIVNTPSVKTWRECRCSFTCLFSHLSSFCHGLNWIFPHSCVEVLNSRATVLEI